MAYQLEGSILEVCNCNILCPCWVGEDPDNGTCDSVLAYHFDWGTIKDVDASGLTLGLVAHIPGSPAYVAKASRWRAKHAALGFDLDLKGHNAIQGAFRFEG